MSKYHIQEGVFAGMSAGNIGASEIYLHRLPRKTGPDFVEIEILLSPYVDKSKFWAPVAYRMNEDNQTVDIPDKSLKDYIMQHYKQELLWRLYDIDYNEHDLFIVELQTVFLKELMRAE